MSSALVLLAISSYELRLTRRPADWTIYRDCFSVCWGLFLEDGNCYRRRSSGAKGCSYESYIRTIIKLKSKVSEYEGAVEVRNSVQERSCTRQGKKNGGDVSRNRGQVSYKSSAECLEGNKAEWSHHCESAKEKRFRQRCMCSRCRYQCRDQLGHRRVRSGVGGEGTGGGREGVHF